MKSIIVLENIRSAYNVGNILRTADALGYGVVLSGYTPSPFEKEKVSKTSLGAEEYVPIQQFRNPQEALDNLREKGYLLIAAEESEESISLTDWRSPEQPVALIVGNEKEGVLPETLAFVDQIVHIPMLGHKESLNVGQAAAIVMRCAAELQDKKIKR